MLQCPVWNGCFASIQAFQTNEQSASCCDLDGNDLTCQQCFIVAFNTAPCAATASATSCNNHSAPGLPWGAPRGKHGTTPAYRYPLHIATCVMREEVGEAAFFGRHWGFRICMVQQAQISTCTELGSAVSCLPKNEVLHIRINVHESCDAQTST